MTIQPPSGVIFDLEGTLVDFQWKITEAVAEVKGKIKEWEWTTPLADIRDYAQLFNTGIRIAPGAEEKARFLDLINEIYDTYDKDALTRWRPQPGADPLLKHLSEKQVPLAVCSNVGRKAMQGILALLGWEKIFRTVITRDDVVFLKPETEGLLKTAGILGLALSSIIFIGDSRTDFLTAREAGCSVIIVARGENTRKELEPLHPNYLFSSMDECRTVLFPEKT